MQMAALHLLGAFLSGAIALLGRFGIRNAPSFVKFFSFGSANAGVIPARLGRLAGWFFLIFGSMGVLFYLILIPIDLVSLNK
jgi:hypothetical protein